ncbi:RNA methyltransferase [Rhizobiales bacterium RZME27]|jgi:tRNA G18 (ribose-2'-O)-methylase SpoU|uniref:RNA methyltransferase n=1 Tax=Endobacterium cereale TaxID=2663029 RepID=A0A6A8AJP4_9HYPH|nr:RNA methyltransferase [Endobacterium cereale]MEB2845871.1 RNA methyltransferase [Endobacterium cereale]MQY49960.1 RNA methyltransferase [Endobacterium cereale]
MRVEGNGLTRIDDPADPRIAEFRDIKERDLAGRQGRFIIEGTVVLRMATAAHGAGAFAVEKILLLENRVDGVQDILAGVPEDVPVYVASSAVLDAIAGFHLHRGILALGRRVAEPELDALIDRLPERALVVAACGISNHDNIGAMFRNAAAFGADAVLLDETCCDPLYRKALRVSVGSVLSVPYARGGSILSLLERLAERGLSIWGLSPAGTADLREIPPEAGGIALVTGTEGEGLPRVIMSRFSTARISQRPGLDSLNAGMATGIALYEIARIQQKI